MIDHLMAFVDEIAAHADDIVGQYWTPGTKGTPPAWDAECLPDIVVWDPATDTIETVDGVPIITPHPIDTQFRVTITLPAPQELLVNHPNCELAVDHATGTVLSTRFTPEQLATLRMEPVLAGSSYPFLFGSGGLTR